MHQAWLAQQHKYEIESYTWVVYKNVGKVWLCLIGREGGVLSLDVVLASSVVMGLNGSKHSVVILTVVCRCFFLWLGNGDETRAWGFLYYFVAYAKLILI